MRNDKKKKTEPTTRNGSDFSSHLKKESENQKMFSERLRKLREKMGYSQSKLAKKIGVTTTSIQNLEYKGLPKTGVNLALLAEVLKCSADWLLYGEEKGVVKTINFDAFGLIEMAEARLNAGGGLVVASEQMEDFYAFRNDWLHRVATSKENVVLMRVEGDSMEDTVFDGDTVMVDLGRQEIKSGRIFALGVGETVMLKRLEYTPANTVKVKSDNQAYEPYELQPNEIRIIGQVIWIARQLVRFDL